MNCKIILAYKQCVCIKLGEDYEFKSKRFYIVGDKRSNNI